VVAEADIVALAKDYGRYPSDPRQLIARATITPLRTPRTINVFSHRTGGVSPCERDASEAHFNNRPDRPTQ
jgi:hypothetical protein